MRDNSKYGDQRTFWQVCVSIVLIGLVLYNPFLALTNHSSGLELHALARHRATVGASEMQHFTPVQGGNARADVSLEESATELVVERYEYPRLFVQNEGFSYQPQLIDSIWFRPPPSL